MSNKSILLSIVSLALGFCSKAEKNPNVVIIMADDLGWGDVGYHGSTIKTPNIDRLARDGIELDRYYAAPISSPSRAGLMTGRYPSRFGFREVVIPPWREDGLDENECTIADMLGENGYLNRAIIGKWHLGHTRKVHYPLSRGFTHFYGHLNGAIEYFTHHREGELDWHNDWESCYDKGYSTDLITQEAMKCIGDYSKEGPYFLYVAYNAPHTPYEVPEDELAEHISLDAFNALEKKKDKDGWRYRAMVTRMDKGIGHILDAIEASGEMDNTIILFMSDNGGVPNMEPYSVSGSLRGHKFDEWDGGVRVAASISWKKGFNQGGRKLDQVTGIVDILPTLADIVGAKKAPKNPYDGISVYPVLKGEQESIKRDMYLGVGAAVNHDWKFIIAGRNPGLGLKEDFLVDYRNNPYEEDGKAVPGNDKVKEKMRVYIEKYDTITPSVPEIPYGKGKIGFVAPKEWKVTKP